MGLSWWLGSPMGLGRSRLVLLPPLPLRTLVTSAFSYRRKTLKNGLKTLLTGEEIEACGIDPQVRPETLTPAQFGQLAVAYSRVRRELARQSA